MYKYLNIHCQSFTKKKKKLDMKYEGIEDQRLNEIICLHISAFLFVHFPALCSPFDSHDTKAAFSVACFERVVKYGASNFQLR